MLGRLRRRSAAPDGFVVRAAGFVEDDDYMCLVLAESEDEHARRLEISVDRQEPSDEERAAGLVGACLANERQQAVYGGLRAWQVEQDSLVLVLTDSAARQLGTSETLVLPLRLHEGEVPSVVAWMRSVAGASGH